MYKKKHTLHYNLLPSHYIILLHRNDTITLRVALFKFCSFQFFYMYNTIYRIFYPHIFTQLYKGLIW